MLKNNFLAKSVKFALIGGAATAALTAAPIVVAEEKEEVERISVTGSRIKRADMENSNPVFSFSSENLKTSGVTNIGEFLATVSQADLSGLTQLTNNTNGNDGTQTISLRNMGSDRTLVLVDGKRFLALGGGQVDISAIPVSIVERIDILGDGASAVYGSDAIAGVVNIITKRSFDGARVEVGAGGYFEGDGENNSVDFTVGVSNDKTSAFVNVSRTSQKPIGAGDRDISKYPVAYIPERYGSAFGLYGRFVTSDGLVALDPSKEGEGTRTADDFIPWDNKAHRYNYAPTNYLLTPSDRLSVFSKVEHAVTENINAYAKFMYNQRKSVTQIAAVPLTAGYSGPQWEIDYSKDNIYNPFGEDISQWGFRSLPVGPRTERQDYDTYFLDTGLEGEFEIGDRSFSWDVSFARGESSRSATGDNYINLANLANAVGPSFIQDGVAQCGTEDDVIAGCVPLNLFNGETGFTQEMADYVGYSFNEKVDTGNRAINVNVSGDLFELPAGWVAAAVGYENRTNTYSDNPDSLIASGLSSSNYREPTDGTQRAEEAYIELVVPVLADLPAVDKLELQLAARRSEFNNSGTVGTTPVESEFSNTSFKYAFTWRVFDDLMLRGNYSDTFRAPSVDDLFSGGGEGFPSVEDPCNTDQWGEASADTRARCISDGVPNGGVEQPTSQLRSLGGGNPYLSPEEGVTRTLGFVYNPSWLENFDLSVDYYRINLTDALDTLGAFTMLDRCYVQGEDQFCQFVERRDDGQVQTVRTADFNLNKLETDGFDIDANYRYETSDFGEFAFRVKASYTHSYKEAGEGESLDEATNRVDDLNSSILKWRGTFNTTWIYEDLTVNWSMRYLDSLRESCWITQATVDAYATQDPCNDRENGENRIGSVVYHDVSANYSLPWDASVIVGMRNVFKKEPPVAVQPFANSFYQGHDIPGGQWFARYTQTF